MLISFVSTPLRFIPTTLCILGAILCFFQLLDPLRIASYLPEKAPPPPDPILKALPSSTPFPRKIWQTSKLPFTSWDESDREVIKTWTKTNPRWRHETLTSDSSETYVREKFAHRPEIKDVFEDIHDPILRADLIRYLVLLADGGVYADIDVKLLKPIDYWIPSEFHDQTNLLVGVEYDVLDGGRWGDWVSDLSFATWTIMAKPGHPALETTVHNVIESLKGLAMRQDVPLSMVKASYFDVLNTTGPNIFTDAVFEHLAKATATNFNYSNITNLTEPRLVEDVLILPITGFGAGQQHSNSRRPESNSALVQHMFKGSWKGDHSMESEEDKKKEEEEKKKEEEEKKKEEEEKKKEEEEKKKEEEERKKEEEEERKKEEEQKRKKEEEKIKQEVENLKQAEEQRKKGEGSKSQQEEQKKQDEQVRRFGEEQKKQEEDTQRHQQDIETSQVSDSISPVPSSPANFLINVSSNPVISPKQSTNLDAMTVDEDEELWTLSHGSLPLTPPKIVQETGSNSPTPSAIQPDDFHPDSALTEGWLGPNVVPPKPTASPSNSNTASSIQPWFDNNEVR
ncbi:MAG: hypothetical protein M1834_001552 [Cirrosporium novae-zelandiae]|nr:MAG: hypothetical protein M1834_004069 [Cirrosporium novae-zelandiae]KAI9735537.1 MAG: hypothetical protein M1834_001552 [Cirrosporium novae-zelandiae]